MISFALLMNAIWNCKEAGRGVWIAWRQSYSELSWELSSVTLYELSQAPSHLSSCSQFLRIWKIFSLIPFTQQLWETDNFSKVFVDKKHCWRDLRNQELYPLLSGQTSRSEAELKMPRKLKRRWRQRSQITLGGQCRTVERADIDGGHLLDVWVGWRMASNIFLLSFWSLQLAKHLGWKWICDS